MIADEKEYSNVYAIPANYTDSGKLFGGMLETRNTIEAIFLVMLVGYPELKWLSVSPTIKIVIMIITLLPICVISLMGINGDSLLQYAWHMICFWIHQRKLHYRRAGYRYAIRKKTNNKKKRRSVRSGLSQNKRHKKRYH